MSRGSQSLVAAVAGLAGLLFGFDTAVVSGVTSALREAFSLSAAGLGLVVSSALWGTLAGSLVIGKPGDRFGALAMLRLVACLYVGAAAGAALADSLAGIVVSRFLIGVAIGGSSVLAPVYIAEVASAQRRGATVGLFQVNIVIGILLAYVSNFAVESLVASGAVWRWKLGAAVLPAGVFLALLLLIPQSPRWLVQRGRNGEAVDSLARLGAADPRTEMLEIAQFTGGPATVALSWQRHRRPLVLAIGLALFNQLSGINAILYYLKDIFTAAGFSGWSSDLQSIAIGVVNLFATMVGMALIDRIGRRQLLLVGSVGTAIAQGMVAAVMSGAASRTLLLPLLALFIAAFALSQGAVIWVYLSEIFPTAVRARGQAVGSATHWIMNALISALFPVIATFSRPAPFAFFALAMMLQFVLVSRYFPETKGLSLERVSDEIEKSTRTWRATRD